MTNKDRKYRLRCIGGFWTSLIEDDRGEPVASIILPSECELEESPTRCYTNDLTGIPTKTHPGTDWIKPSTLHEIEDADYRACAKMNAKLVQSLATHPSTQFSLADRLMKWSRDVPANKLRVFYGGDAAVRNWSSPVMCIAACAKACPAKLFMSRTSSLLAVGELAKLAKEGDWVLPSNMILFIEDVGQDPDLTGFLDDIESDLPTLSYAMKGEDDLTFFPDADDAYTIKLPTHCFKSYEPK